MEEQQLLDPAERLIDPLNEQRHALFPGRPHGPQAAPNGDEEQRRRSDQNQQSAQGRDRFQENEERDDRTEHQEFGDRDQEPDHVARDEAERRFRAVPHQLGRVAVEMKRVRGRQIPFEQFLRKVDLLAEHEPVHGTVEHGQIAALDHHHEDHCAAAAEKHLAPVVYAQSGKDRPDIFQIERKLRIGHQRDDGHHQTDAENLQSGAEQHPHGQREALDLLLPREDVENLPLLRCEVRVRHQKRLCMSPNTPSQYPRRHAPSILPRFSRTRNALPINFAHL